MKPGKQQLKSKRTKAIQFYEKSAIRKVTEIRKRLRLWQLSQLLKAVMVL